MPSRSVPVAWEVAEDAGMRTVVARGVEQARIENAHSVHVELRGLKVVRCDFPKGLLCPWPDAAQV